MSRRRLRWHQKSLLLLLLYSCCLCLVSCSSEKWFGECWIFTCELPSDKRLESAPEYVAAKSPTHICGSEKPNARMWQRKAHRTPIIWLDYVAAKDPQAHWQTRKRLRHCCPQKAQGTQIQHALGATNKHLLVVWINS